MQVNAGKCHAGKAHFALRTGGCTFLVLGCHCLAINVQGLLHCACLDICACHALNMASDWEAQPCQPGPGADTSAASALVGEVCQPYTSLLLLQAWLVLDRPSLSGYT